MARRSLIAGLTFVGAAGLFLLLVQGLQAPRTEPPRAPPAPFPAPSLPQPGGHTGFVGVIVPEGSVDVSARVEGRLHSIHVQVGDSVRQGDVLARLDVRPLQHERALTEADLRAARAEEDVARLALAEARESLERSEDPRLAGLGALSSEELARLRYAEQKALARLETARAQVQRHQALLEQVQLRLSEATLVAPFDGRVSLRYLDAGALVATGQPIVHLLQDGNRKVRFAIPEEHALQVAVGTPVLIRTPGEGRPLRGLVEKVAPEVNAVSLRVLAIASLAPRDGQQPPFGTVVRVWPDATAVASGGP